MSLPRLSASRPFVVLCRSGFGLVPSAMITASQSVWNSDPSIGTGLLLPEASGSPSSMRMQSMPFTQPFSSVVMRTGFVRRLKMMPSCFAWPTSSFLAGSSSSDLL